MIDITELAGQLTAFHQKVDEDILREKLDFKTNEPKALIAWQRFINSPEITACLKAHVFSVERKGRYHQAITSDCLQASLHPGVPPDFIWFSRYRDGLFHWVTKEEWFMTLKADLERRLTHYAQKGDEGE